MSKTLFLLSLLIVNLSSVQSQSVDKDTVPYVVMLSLDGFRWDYPDKAFTPNLDYIAKHGVKANSLKPSFPTKTFPNHYTIVTGLYPDNHGLINNSFYDSDSDKYYKIRDSKAVTDGTFYGGEPIWNTAEKQGIKTASYFWVGSEANIQNMNLSRFKKYEHNFPYEQRIDSIISWLQLPLNDRPHLLTWYIDQPDTKGHKYGPDSKEMSDYIPCLDSLVGVFIKKVENLPNADKINIIIVSDHGMATISEEKTIYLNKHINFDWIEKIQGSNPVYNIRAKLGYKDSLYAALNSIPHAICWKAKEVPEYLNYGTHKRNLDLILTCDNNWSIYKYKKYPVSGGTHGYDNRFKDMDAIFYAIGPAFKKNYKQKTFENVNIYVLIAKILGLKPAKTDGNIKIVEGMLAK